MARIAASRRTAGHVQATTSSMTLATSDPTVWEHQLARWLAPYLDLLGDARRKPWLPLYVRGLLSAAERKSFTPMASHLSQQDGLAANANYHGLQQFMTYSAWSVASMARLLAQQADLLLGGADAVLIVDDTAVKKQGKHSVGVAHQYCGEVGKLANCQCFVTLTLAQDEVPIPLALKLYLPADWTDDQERCVHVGVPEAVRIDQYDKTKINLALDEIERLRDSGVRFGVVAADAAYGTSAAFRHGVDAMGYRYAVGVQSHTRVYALDATMVYPKRSTKPRTGAKYEAKQPRRIALGRDTRATEYPVGCLRVRSSLPCSPRRHSVVPIVDGHSRTVNTFKKCPQVVLTRPIRNNSGMRTVHA